MMFRKIVQILAPYAHWKNVWIGLGLIVSINLAVFPYFLHQMKKVAPNAATPIDLKFTYSPDEVYQMVESYGEEGRKIYTELELKVDIIYPIIYTLTTIFVLFLLLKKAYPENPKIQSWALLPLLTFFADIFENIGILAMLHGFPEKMDTIAKVTSSFSSIKWIVVGINLLLIIFLLLKSLFTKKV